MKKILALLMALSIIAVGCSNDKTTTEKVSKEDAKLQEQINELKIENGKLKTENAKLKKQMELIKKQNQQNSENDKK